MKKLALAALALGLLAVLLVILDGSDRTAESLDSAAAARQVATQDPRQAPELTDQAGDARRAVDLADQVLPASPPEALVAGPGATTRVHGRIVASDVTGLPMPPLDGTLTVARGGTQLELPVVQGRFDGRLEPDPEGAPFLVTGVQLADVAMRLDPRRQRLLPDHAAAQEVHVQMPTQLLLEVVEAGTLQPVTNVWLRPGRGLFQRRLSPPFDGSAAEHWSTASPVDLGDLPALFDRGFEHLLVGAEGYAWREVHIDLSTQGVATIELDPGADLQVEVRTPADADFQPSIELRLVALDEPLEGRSLTGPVDSEPAATVELSGLQPGGYYVTVRVVETGAVLASSKVELRAGHNPTLVLECIVAAPPLFAPVSIRLVRPASWGTEQPTAFATLALSEGARRDLDFEVEAKGQGHWQLTHAGLTPGDYLLAVREPQASFRIHVPAEGLTDLELRLLELVEVTVATIDATSGLAVPVDSLSWTNPGEGSSTGLYAKVPSSEEPGLFHLRVPLGRATVSGMHRGSHVRGDFDVTSAGQNFELPVQVTFGFSLVLLDGGTSLPFESFLPMMSSLAIDGPGKLVQFSMTPGAYGIVLSQTGTYTISLTESGEFEAAGPFVVEVPEEGTPRLEVELVRRPE